jgi:hypothetical protein
MDGWLKPKKAAAYAGVSERSFRDWLHNGLEHSRLPSGHILIRVASIDKYLGQFSVSDSKVDKIVKDIMRGL